MEDRMSVLNGASSDPRDFNSPEELELERVLVEKASEGDQRAVGALYDRYVSSLYRFCLSKTGNETDAEDLTEDIFLKAITCLAKTESEER